MDNKRYQVFVSSTYQDLTDERAAVIQAILNLEHLPAGMEMFPAANADQMTLIKRVIDESDYYVVVVAGRYGSVDAEGISYTEQEYDYAVQTGKPILGFVHGDPDRIEAGKTDQKDAAREKLAEFRKRSSHAWSGTSRAPPSWVATSRRASSARSRTIRASAGYAEIRR